MSGKVNLAIIGNNFGKNVHYPIFKNIKDVNVIDIYTKNWKNIFSNKNIDAISIAVPPLISFDIISMAIKNNKHIFCEKPLAANLDDATKIKDLLHDQIIHAVDFELCESKILKEVKKLINSKYLGKIKTF